jgi:hypothetical protein
MKDSTTRLTTYTKTRRVNTDHGTTHLCLELEYHHNHGNPAQLLQVGELVAVDGKGYFKPYPENKKVVVCWSGHKIVTATLTDDEGTHIDSRYHSNADAALRDVLSR